jgi:hypothetical protein
MVGAWHMALCTIQSPWECRRFWVYPLLDCDKCTALILDSNHRGQHGSSTLKLKQL